MLPLIQGSAFLLDSIKRKFIRIQDVRGALAPALTEWATLRAALEQPTCLASS